MYRTEPLDDVLSFLITIGSPALAAHSLQITHLNARWITTAFSDVKYPNSKHISTVLSAFHHVPIQISRRPPLLHSLIVLHENDEFWSHLFKAVKKTRRWSIPLVVNFVLVIFAVFLTILDAVYSPRPGDIGYAIVATWTFLLPLIIGWLQVGCEPEPHHLKDSLAAANQKAWVATGQRGQPVNHPPAIEFTKADEMDLARRDEFRTTPVFNYSRAFVSPLAAELVLGLVKNAAANAEQRIPLGTIVGGGVPVWVEGEGNTIHEENRIGTDAEVIDYCTRVLPQPGSNSSSATQLDTHPPETTGIPDPPLPLHGPRPVTQGPSLWATGIWKRVAVSAALALGLQWGTVGAAVLINYVVPPAGMGCRALSFLLYCVAGTTSFFLFLASSVLGHMSRPHHGQRYEPDRLWLRDCQIAGAIVCRWLGKSVAILSAVGILVVCSFQITGAFDNCFCSSTTFDNGRDSVTFQTLNNVIEPYISRVWIGGFAMTFSTAVLFGLSICLTTPRRR